MRNATRSAPSRRKSSGAKAKKGTAFGRRLIRGAEQILAYQRGEIEAEVYTLPGPLGVKAIRGKTGLSQAKFAETFAFNKRTLQDWERNKGVPLGPVRAYPKVIDQNPDAVIAALRS
jgi:putative transcriptional regulator